MDIEARVRKIFEAEAAAILSIPVNGEFERAIKTMRECHGNVLDHRDG